MKKLNAFLLLSIILFSCEQKTSILTDLKPTYSNFKNIWQERNLYGKVKEIETYKTVYQKDKADDREIVNLKEAFTDFGALKEASYFDGQGELTENTILEYDKKGFNFKTLAQNKLANINSVSLKQRDTVNKTETNTAFINNNLKTLIKIFFNDKGKAVKQINIDGRDTIVTRTNYELDNVGNIVSESRIEGNETKPTYFDHYLYDKNNNLIESSFSAWGSTKIFKTEWKNGQIYKRTEYTISRDLKKQLNEETEYDKLYNPISLKIYQDSKLNRALKYNYEYDKNGNWVKRDVSMKEYLSNSTKFTPIYNETRKIRYWK